MYYPLKFKPIFKEKIWGGQKIRNILGKDFGALPNCGESWELSGVDDNVSIISNGEFAGKDLKSVLKEHGRNILGSSHFEKFGSNFPLLVKFIDANDDLSIQVHPNDELAKKRHNGSGKTEMWYVVDADDGASLISGFNQKVDKKKYQSYFDQGRIMEILNSEEVVKDDVFFLPAGRVHTIGKGLLIAEVQQTSDITYRIYDFDRVDANGNERELHTEEALDAIDYTYHDQYKTTYSDSWNEPVELVNCSFFTTNKLKLNREFNLENRKDRFMIYTCVHGSGSLQHDLFQMKIELGDVLLIPAAISNITFDPDHAMHLLESYIK